MNSSTTATARRFTAAEFRDRRDRLQDRMAAERLSCLVVTAPEDVYYLAGLEYQGYFSFTSAILGRDESTLTLVARAMEQPTVTAQVPDCRFIGYGDDADPAETLAGVLTEFSLPTGRVGYQPTSLSFPIAVWRDTDRRLTDVEWVDATALPAGARMERGDTELCCVRDAASLSDVGMNAGIEAVRPGAAESQVAAAILAAMVGAGSDQPGFVPLVRTLDRIDQDHLSWSNRCFEADETVLLELSGSVARYHAPLSRTVPVNPDAAPNEAVDIAHVGMAAIRAALRPGNSYSAVYRGWRHAVSRALGYDYQRHH
ncbi:MAG: M24 family metallopeptidase, partial [Stackebrandtia sp.]